MHKHRPSHSTLASDANSLAHCCSVHWLPCHVLGRTLTDGETEAIWAEAHPHCVQLFPSLAIYLHVSWGEWALSVLLNRSSSSVFVSCTDTLIVLLATLAVLPHHQGTSLHLSLWPSCVLTRWILYQSECTIFIGLKLSNNTAHCSERAKVLHHKDLWVKSAPGSWLIVAMVMILNQ